MSSRYWFWVMVRLAVGVAIVAWAASYLGPGGGEKEFQKTLEAMKQVHSFRAAFSANPGTQHNEILMEVDCNRDLLHYQWHFTDSSNPAAVVARDEIHVANVEFDHESDGSWSRHQYPVGVHSAKAYCGKLAQGADTYLLPQIATMIQRGVLQKGDKKTVNGVRCREWLVAMRGAPSGLEHDTVCLGLQDHLPYELTVDWQSSRSSFSDYNSPIQFDIPEAALQPAAATTGSN
jgi:hypothetical protein